MNRTRYFATTFLVLASIAVGVGVSELAVRILYPQTLGIWFVTRDGLITHYANKNSYHHGFGTVIKINSLGMRDQEHAAQKRPGLFRVLLLGDSFMEALQVNFEESMPSLLERALNSDAPGRAEVLNASVSGWGTDDELVYLMRYGAALRPDLVLIGVTLHNDVSDNLLEEFHFIKGGELHERPIHEIPYWKYKELQLKTYLASNFHLYQIFLRAWRSQLGKVEAQRLDTHVAELLRIQSGPEVEKGWKLTRALLRKTNQEARKIGAKFALILIPLEIQVSDEKLAQFLIRHNLAPGDIEIAKPQRMLRKIAQEEGIEAFDLLAEFKEWTVRTGEDLYLEADGHWNAKAHRLAADLTTRTLVNGGIARTVDSALLR